jgi:DNA-binding response OmpR family regulator
VSDAYDLGANCYIVKPIDLDEFVAVLSDIERFWLVRATLPGE